MISKADTTTEYLKDLPAERRDAMNKLRSVIKENLPKGFEEKMAYGMITYCVPHSIYPKGYHCNPEQALPFISIASQKNFIAMYHMGIYGSPELLKWFQENYAKEATGKLDMGKSCIRFKKMENIPFKLIGKLAGKMTPKNWIDQYEKLLNRN